MAERVDQLIPYGYAETWIGTFHAFGDRVLREAALEVGPEPGVPRARAAEQIIFLRERLFQLPLERFRPLGDPTRHLARAARPGEPRQGRGRVARAVPRVGRGAHGGAAAHARRGARRGGDSSSSSPRSTRPTSACWRRRARSTSATRSTARSPCCASARRLAGQAARALSLRAGRRVPGHEPRAARAGAASCAASGHEAQHHGGGRRRPGHLPLARRGRGEPAGLPAPVSRARARWC